MARKLLTVRLSVPIFLTNKPLRQASLTETMDPYSRLLYAYCALGSADTILSISAVLQCLAGLFQLTGTQTISAVIQIGPESLLCKLTTVDT